MFVALIRRVEERQKDCVWSLSFGRCHYCAAQRVRFAETHLVTVASSAVFRLQWMRFAIWKSSHSLRWHSSSGMTWTRFCDEGCKRDHSVSYITADKPSASTVLWLCNYVVKIPCSTLNFINNQGCSWNRKFVLNFDFLKPMHMKYLYPHVVARFNVFELQIVAAKSSEFHF